MRGCAQRSGIDLATSWENDGYASGITERGGTAYFPGKTTGPQEAAIVFLFERLRTGVGECGFNLEMGLALEFFA
jgi:hypothetical protein